MKIFNYSAGPSMVPVAVMKRIQDEFTDYNSTGIGIVEMSHRTPKFYEIMEQAKVNVKKLMKISDEYEICFIQGGSSLQFAMLPMNFMLPKGFAEYADSGYWSQKAIAEGGKIGKIKIIGSSSTTGYDRVPSMRKWKPAAESSYLHITSNDTIYGVQYHSYPELDNGVPLVVDMSTDIMTRYIDVNQFGFIYASTQKVLGPTGLALVIIKKDLADRSKDKSLPFILDYRTYINEKSLYNTPPTFSIYFLLLITEWLMEQGGISAMEKINTVKSEMLYEEIDSSSFYTNSVEPGSRSRTNIIFKTPSKKLDECFVHEAHKAGLIGLRGHRAVEGLRASMYNAMPLEGAEVLIDFMNEFESRHG